MYALTSATIRSVSMYRSHAKEPKTWAQTKNQKLPQKGMEKKTLKPSASPPLISEVIPKEINKNSIFLLVFIFGWFNDSGNALL